MSDRVTIRDASDRDAAALADLMTQLGYPTSANQMLERLRPLLAHEDYATLVAESEGAVVGMAGVCTGLHYARDGSYGRIVALVVDERHRGRGVGKALVAHAEAWIRSRSGESVIVNTRATRADAHRFYRGLGFTKTGIRFVKKLPL